MLIFCSVGVITVVFIASMGVALLGRVSIGHGVQALGDRLIPIRFQSSELSRAFVDQETGQRGYLLTSNPIALELYEAGTASANRLIPTLQRELAGMPEAGELLALFDSELAAAGVWKKLIADRQIAVLRSGSVTRPQLDQMVLDAKAAFDHLRERFRAFNARIDALIAEQTTHIRSVLRLVNISQSLAAAILAVGIVGCIVIVQRMLTRPVSTLVRDVRAVADGNYDQPIGRGGPREVAEIAAAVDDMRNRLRELARFDSVTGLVNRAETMARFDAALARPPVPGGRLGVLYCDIDHFKQINDTWGHAVGDAVLSTIAARMRECVHLEDTVGRIGGDEILILLSSVGSADEVEEIGERIRRLAEEPIHQFGLTVQTSLSIGSTASLAGETAADVMARADAAMYRAKQAGRNAVFAVDA